MSNAVISGERLSATNLSIIAYISARRFSVCSRSEIQKPKPSAILPNVTQVPPLSSLTDAIGEPKNESYASSCLGDGEDGELSYDGFTVYTYRAPDGTETVYDVLAQK